MLTLTEQYTEIPPHRSNGSGIFTGAETISSSTSGHVIDQIHALTTSDQKMISSLMHWWLTYSHTYSPQYGSYTGPLSGNEYCRTKANDPDLAWSNASSETIMPQNVWESSSTD